MKLNTEDKGWNPYLAGALVGLLAIFSAYATSIILGKTNYLGASTTFVRAAGHIVQFFSPEHVANNEYYLKEKVKIDWQYMLIIGIFIGAFISSLLDRSFKIEKVPPIWEKNFGPSVFKRALAAFFGGIVAMIGARMADGCPSGHGLSGNMQLSLSALFALTIFFLFGVIVANIFYKEKDL